jgi:hypothetical protein
MRNAAAFPIMVLLDRVSRLSEVFSWPKQSNRCAAAGRRSDIGPRPFVGGGWGLLTRLLKGGAGIVFGYVVTTANRYDFIR